jgi:hypothetical protein
MAELADPRAHDDPIVAAQRAEHDDGVVEAKRAPARSAALTYVGSFDRSMASDRRSRPRARS